MLLSALPLPLLKLLYLSSSALLQALLSGAGPAGVSVLVPLPADAAGCWCR